MRGGRNHFGNSARETPEKGKNAGNPNLHNGRWDQAFHPKGRNRRTVWEIPLGPIQRDSFLTVYPEKLVEICLLASTKKGDVIMDPFTGAGTTGSGCYSKTTENSSELQLVRTYQEMAQESNQSTVRSGVSLLQGFWMSCYLRRNSWMLLCRPLVISSNNTSLVRIMDLKDNMLRRIDELLEEPKHPELREKAAEITLAVINMVGMLYEVLTQRN